MNSQVRVRIAPSPSGYLHVGTARIAICNWLFARHHKGKFILRIEDTDPSRSYQEMVEVILESMKWLGLSWDEGPYFQSQRFELYQKYAKELIQNKKAYYCYCPSEVLKQKREEAVAQKKAWKYNRTCLKLSDEEKEKLEKEKTPRAIRLLVPEGETSFDDLVYKSIKKDNRDLDDLIIMRSDGRPIYNFACVVDDIEMKISHVIRGNDHISNTFKQVLIYNALGIKPPFFAHLPLSLSKERAKISKREGAVSITEYRDNGYLSEAMFNFLSLLGWSPKDEREILSKDELIELFGLDGISPSNPIFDMQKLEWMNGEYIRSYDEGKLLDLVIPFLEKENLIEKSDIDARRDWLLRFVFLLKERCKTLKEFAQNGKYFFAFDYKYEPKAASKHFSSAEVGSRLKTFLGHLSSLDEFKKEKIEQTMRNLADELKIKPANLIHPIRLAVTGTSAGPPLFDILEVLGKEEVIKRIEKATGFIEEKFG